ncbi:helix-turn-helix domain-containing protein [Lederbergia sp. NSJ-179]|uniref:helix-turn-helix domain-containing protein n=1 Tax=Lederbergia sp. NSJ-179 TaxID=2931402 RepID=UPI001FD546D3|nr:helix-turn-helix domain-containing protein [Lederbergia sp. NSJ-179]MCJ7839430.1 helix-turn-helix domain-containing protein [Lederbergia sp. NSJ-179]
MTFLHALLLKCLRKINGERTIYSIYHLLAGKKSSQTLQDAHLFHLAPFFKTMPDINRSRFNRYIQYLIEQNDLDYDSRTFTAHITEKGIKTYTEYFEKIPVLKYLHGLKYQDATIQMWNRLTLLVQALSHLNHADKRYHPVNRDPEIHLWVKNYVLENKINRTDLSFRLYEELQALLRPPFPEDPVTVIWRLSGYQMIGWTDKQTAEYLHVEQTEYHFRFLNGLHYWLQTIMKDPQKFRVMHSIIADLYQKFPLTKTAQRTAELLAANLSVEEVASRRHLKQSTIEDHIIEIAMNDLTFSIEPFIDEQLVNEILSTAKQLKVKKLKPIKEKIGASSYFQIRLALARLGGEE